VHCAPFGRYAALVQTSWLLVVQTYHYGWCVTVVVQGTAMQQCRQPNIVQVPGVFLAKVIHVNILHVRLDQLSLGLFGTGDGPSQREAMEQVSV
jgi:hypothetical protein